MSHFLPCCLASSSSLVQLQLNQFDGTGLRGQDHVLYVVDLETLADRDKRELFVGLSRAQMRVDLVLSERAALALFDLH